MIMEWRRVFPVGLFLSFFLSFSTFAFASGAPYVSAQAGGAFLMDSDAGIVDNISFDPGFYGALAVGYDFGEKYSHARLEAEAAYRQNHVDDVDFLGEDRGAYGKAYSASFLLNAYYEYQNPTFVKPFIMGGLGFAWGEISELKSVGDVTIINDNDFQFAYQGGAGLSFDVNPSFAVDVGYRFFTTTKFQFEDEAGNDADFLYQSNTGYLGLRYTF
jgi:OOP family OmpA-OmpF porin